MSLHLFVHAHTGDRVPATLPEGVTASALGGSPAEAAQAFARVLGDPAVKAIVCWQLALGPVPWLAISELVAGKDDAWHIGPRLSGRDERDLLRYVLPLWVYRSVPPSDLDGGINWRIDLRACVLRASVLRAVGGLAGELDTLAAAGHELGLRLLRRGGVCRQRPALLETTAHPIEMSPADRYRIVGRILSWRWQGYAVARQVIDGQSLLGELGAWRAARRAAPVAQPPVGALHRDLEQVALPLQPRVSVVLPTFGRYRYLAEVLEDLRAQSIAPVEIIIADGNPPEARAEAPYERFRDLPIDVIWHEAGGTCSSRNACLERATGDYVWFVDDDSRFDARNLELHLRALGAYGADVSVGPAYTRQRPELHAEQRELACSFMDCGTTLVRRALLDEVGGFDMQFNQYLAGEDGELGIRFVRAGGLMINNPHARRFHYLAPIGGARRSKNNVHRWTRWSLLPRPVQSIYYTALRHFEPTVAVDAVVQAGMVAGWRRKEGERASVRWKLTTALAELAALPLTAYRMWHSAAIGRSMIDAGPRIPVLAARDRIANRA